MKHLLLVVALLYGVGMAGKDRNDELPPIKYAASPAIIKGKVKGYKALGGRDSVLFTYTVFVSNERDSIYAPIAFDGTFTAELKTFCTDRVDLHWADTMVVFVAIPGEEMTVTIDPARMGVPDSKKPAFEFSGSIGEFNTDLVRYASEFEPVKILAPIQGDEGIKTLKGLTVMQYRDRVLQLYDEAAGRVDSDRRLCGAYKDYVKAAYKYQIIIKTLLYNTTLMVANDTQEKFELPEEYFSYLTTFHPFASVPIYYFMHPVQVIAVANMFSNYAGEKLDIHPSARQVSDAYQYMQVISDLNVLTDDEIETLKKDCPVLSTVVLKYNDELKAKIESAKNSTDYVVKTISPDLAGEDVFQTLIAPYKGSPLLVDFWATWCGPCRAAMETIKPVKAKLNGKASFIYVTGPSSPRRTWELTIPDIHGDHYYVTEVQYSALLSQFGSQSIPTYVTVDSNGSVINHYIGYPGNDVIEADLREK